MSHQQIMWRDLIRSKSHQKNIKIHHLHFDTLLLCNKYEQEAFSVKYLSPSFGQLKNWLKFKQS